MRFSTRSDVFAQALNDVRPWAVPRDSDPHRGCVRIVASVEDQTLALTCGDMLHSITLKVPAEVTACGSLSLMAKEAAALGKVLPRATDVDVEVNDRHWVKVKWGRKVLEIAGLDGEHYSAPSGPGEDAQCFTVPGALLSKVLGGPLYAVSNDDAAIVLCQLWVESTDEGIDSFATDAHRAAICHSVPSEAFTFRGLIQFIRQGAQRLAKIAPAHPEWTMEIGDDATTGKPMVRCSAGNTVLVLAQMTKSPPPIRRIIPSKYEGECIVEREAIADLADVLKLGAPPDSSAVKITIDADGVHGTSQNRERGSAHDDVPAVGFDGSGITTWVHVQHLADTIAAIDAENVKIKWSTSAEPLAFVTDHSVHLVMSMADR